MRVVYRRCNNDNTDDDLRLQNESSDVIGISTNLELLHVFCTSLDFFEREYIFSTILNILSRARSVDL